MVCYLPDHLVRCLICRDLFSDARRLRCGCVYCYSCCLNLVKDYTLHCHCSVVHRFESEDELEKALVLDAVVNDLVRQHKKQHGLGTVKLVDYESVSPPALPTGRQQVAVAQPPCTICNGRSNQILLCDHCQADICDVCMDEHYRVLAETLERKWMQCHEKFRQIDEHAVAARQRRTEAIAKVDTIRRIVEERTNQAKMTIENHRQSLMRRLDDYVRNIEHTITENHVDEEYRLLKERLPKLMHQESETSHLLSFAKATEGLLQRLMARDHQLMEMKTKMPYLSQPNPVTINASELIGEIEFRVQPAERHVTSFTSKHDLQFYHNGTDIPPLMAPGSDVTRSSNRMPASSTASSVVAGSNGRSTTRVPPPVNTDMDVVPNHRVQWSIDFKEIPKFLAVLDNRSQAYRPETLAHHRHEHMLFVADHFGQLSVYSLPKSMSRAQPSLIGNGVLFSKNSQLLMDSFTVYRFAIIVYVRRFEQRANEIEHSRLIKAGLPIMKGEQGRCNDHGGMIYLFSHGGEEIDGVYQSHPIRVILADQMLGRLWALNPMGNNVYCSMSPNHKHEIQAYLQEEEIILDFANQAFAPSIMIQSDQSLGLIDTERDEYRLYAKDDQCRLIGTYRHQRDQEWHMTGGVIFKDNRTLLKLTEKKLDEDPNERPKQNRLAANPRQCLVELTHDGKERHRIQATTLRSMIIGPNDELLLGFAGRGDRGFLHCY